MAKCSSVVAGSRFGEGVPAKASANAPRRLRVSKLLPGPARGPTDQLSCKSPQPRTLAKAPRRPCEGFQEIQARGVGQSAAWIKTIRAKHSVGELHFGKCYFGKCYFGKHHFGKCYFGKRHDDPKAK